MEVEELIAELEARHPLLELAAILGRDCLRNRKAVEWDLYTAQSDLRTDALTRMEAESTQMWSAEGTPTGGLSSELRAQLLDLGTTPELATQTVLEGMCRGAVRLFFDWTSLVVPITAGSVLAPPARHMKAWNATPNPVTTHRDPLIPSSGFMIWNSEWRLELDYRYRDRLDAVCWQQDALPTIVTLHPFDGDEMDVDQVTDNGFFGVHPHVTAEGGPAEHARTPASNTKHVEQALHHVSGCGQVIVLPEFCLHEPDSLAALARNDADALPPIIVAGSAHWEDGEGRRSNSSVTYLDGTVLVEISKIVPFVYRSAGRELTELIAPRDRVIRLACGSSTRLAVVICSDLNSPEVAAVLAMAGVNLLLCPSWTPRVGTFGGAVAALAAYGQCVGVVVNTPGHPASGPHEQPLWAVSAVPRSGAVPQVHVPEQGRPVAGILDANALPSSNEYWTWLN